MRDKGKRPGSDEDDGGFTEHERRHSYGSNQNISQNQEAHRGNKPYSQSPGFAYASPHELAKSFSQYGYAPVSTPQPQHRRHRSHRDYDSDTGYRSETEVTRYRRQQMLAQYGGEASITITPRKPRGKDGYSSDLEGYSQKRQSTGYTIQQQQPLQNQSKSNSLPYDLNSNPKTMHRNSQGENRAQHLDSVNRYAESASRTQNNNNNQDSVSNRTPQLSHSRRVVVRNDELYSQQLQHNKSVENKSVSGVGYHQPPSPSQFLHGKIMDQSTPVSSDPPSGFTFNTSRSRSNSASGSNDDNEFRPSDWRKDMYSDKIPSNQNRVCNSL